MWPMKFFIQLTNLKYKNKHDNKSTKLLFLSELMVFLKYSKSNNYKKCQKAKK